jgi:hypothetical protein
MAPYTTTYVQKILTGFFLITIPCIFFTLPEIAGSDNKRLLIGIELFPSFLASDVNISNKTDNNNNLCIAIVYQYDKQTADDMAKRLKSLGKIRGIPIKVVVLSVQELEKIEKQIIAGLFIAESMICLPPIIDDSIEKNYIVFSPFEGDVEKGATGGIHITEKIFPYFNLKTAHRAAIKMKSFFIRVSNKYE